MPSQDHNQLADVADQSISSSTLYALAMSPSSQLHFPGDHLPPLTQDAKTNTTFKVGPGLIHIPPSALAVQRAGELNIDGRRHLLWMESNGKRVTPLLHLSIRIMRILTEAISMSLFRMILS